MNKKVICIALAAFAVLACKKNDAARGPSEVVTTGGQLESNPDAIMRLTEARCNREYACNAVGAGQKYTDRDACKRELSFDAETELRQEKCPMGIDNSRLTQCLNDIQNEKCGKALDKMSRLSSCQQDKLCLQYAAPSK